jgi:hypothetical protein
MKLYYKDSTQKFELCLSPVEVWPIFGLWPPIAFLGVLRLSFMRWGCQSYAQPPVILEDQWVASLVSHHKSAEHGGPHQ